MARECILIVISSPIDLISGVQVVANYVAMTPQGKVFDSSLERGSPYDFRVGAGQVIPGLDEGIRSMQPGGVRRLYIPGNLAFPKVGFMSFLARTHARTESSKSPVPQAGAQEHLPER